MRALRLLSPRADAGFRLLERLCSRYRRCFVVHQRIRHLQAAGADHGGVVAQRMRQLLHGCE